MTEWTKHTTHTDALETLGKIIGPDEKRDAIHLAVEPVVAGARLDPGTHVRLDDGVAYRTMKTGNEGVGIVDPFLIEPVEAGEMFWLVVYPRQITSLRHVWEHPAFPVSESLLPPESPHAEGAQRIADWLSGTDLSSASVDDFLEAVATGRGGNSDGYGSLLTMDGDWMTIHGEDGYGQIPDWVWDEVRALGVHPVGTPDRYGCSC
jgi:hypothetical protein